VLIQGLFLIGIFPIYHIPDEEQYMANVRSLSKGEIPYFNAESKSGHPILYELIIYPLFKIVRSNMFYFIARLIGLLFFASALVLAFFITKRLFPDAPFLQVFVVAAIAFNSQITFISGSINSDSLLMMLVTVFIFMAIRLQNKKLTVYDYVYLALILVAGFLTKERFFIVTPFLLYFSAHKAFESVKRWHQAGQSRPLFYFGLPSLAVLAALFSVFVFKYLNQELDMLSYVSQFHTGGLFRIFKQFWWSTFGLLQYPLTLWVYLGFALMVAAAVIGLVLFFLSKNTSAKTKNWLIVFLTASLFMGTSILFYEIKTGTGQGRHAFTLAIPIYILLSVGLDSVGKKLKIQKFFLPAILSSLLAVNLYSIIWKTGWLVG
jgi:hypothetical protein